mmetsp:Transcript_36696/g.96845  ORF Transcript_36696/g.96845 Transcript_36696/m.96845 type:complete len:111 (+) Transcript_36696:7795-8127(+)
MSWVHGCISTALDNPPAELRGLESTGLRGTTPSPSLQPSLQGGGGRYMDTPSPPSANAAADFLQRRAGFSEEEARVRTCVFFMMLSFACSSSIYFLPFVLTKKIFTDFHS